MRTASQILEKEFPLTIVGGLYANDSPSVKSDEQLKGKSGDDDIVVETQNVELERLKKRKAVAEEIARSICKIKTPDAVEKGKVSPTG